MPLAQGLLLALLASALLPALGAIAALGLVRRAQAALWTGCMTAIAGCAVGAAVSVAALFISARAELEVAFRLPLGALKLGLDPLSSFFALCVCVVGLLAAVFGAGYVSALARQRSVISAIVFFNALLTAMLLVVLARDAFVFLVSWELMFLASFFLVTFEHERADVRQAGLSYLVLSHVGVVALIALVAILARGAGSLDFTVLAAHPLAGGTATLGFALALIGFGAKAGFWPLHVWLPEAHPAAPSHVSALMSGVMIKLGIYGLLRFLDFLGPIRASWALWLVGVGVLTGLAGVLHALAQHDLKRLLAYSSVENVGVIALGLGLGLLGRAHGDVTLAALGFAGGLLHVINHGLFKGLLFQGAGSAAHATGTRQLDQQGGLLRRMPVTGSTFLLGSAAIAGLPPLNGFVSELLIFLAALRGASVLPASGAVAALIAIAALGLIGGLVAACFVKAFGIVFLGEPRNTAASHAHEGSTLMRAAMIAGAAACAVIGLWPRGALALVSPLLLEAERNASLTALPALGGVSRFVLALIGLSFVLAVVRQRQLARRTVAQAATWGCGYSKPSARMQYTGASFADPVLSPFVGLIPMHVEQRKPEGYFPHEARYSDRPGDAANERFFLPAAYALGRALAVLRLLQRGRLQIYILYIVLTLVALIAWQLGGGRS